MRIATLKRVFSEVVAVPCAIQVVWDEAFVQQDFKYIESNLPTTTFDGHKITTVVSAKKANVRVPQSIELYSLARTFECCATQTTGFESVWLRQLCDLETLELTNCGINDQSNFADLHISKCIKHLSIELTHLEELFLQHNQLCGQLCVSACTKLRRLNVSHNNFEATLLDDIKLCKSLQEVDASHNLF